jgi:hypothetical protein
LDLGLRLEKLFSCSEIASELSPQTGLKTVCCKRVSTIWIAALNDWDWSFGSQSQKCQKIGDFRRIGDSFPNNQFPDFFEPFGKNVRVDCRETMANMAE